MSDPEAKLSTCNQQGAMGNFYLLNSQEHWAAVCIAKNACTSLKSAVLERSGIPSVGKNELHARIGYSSNSPFLHPIPDGKPTNFLSFAVYRDPVQRFISVYTNFGLDADSHRRFEHLIGVGFDGWIDFANRELERPVLEQDEHVRRQSDYYSLGSVDKVIPIEDLSTWFTENGWASLPKKNPSSAKFIPTPRQVRRVERLYAADYDLAQGGFG